MEAAALFLGVIIRIAIPFVLLFGFSAWLRAWDRHCNLV